MKRSDGRGAIRRRTRMVSISAVLSALGVAAEDCVMVGNDVSEDMVAKRLGMQVFLLTDCLLNKDGVDIDAYPHGDFSALRAFLLGEK